MTEHTKPQPRITPDNKPFWDALRERRLVLPYCSVCGRPHLPPGPVCPFCFADQLHWREASGHGTLASWTVVHKEWFPAFAPDVPYNVVQVELEEGPRLTANIVGLSNERLAVGLPVMIAFDAVSAEITLPRFRPRDL